MFFLRSLAIKKMTSAELNRRMAAGECITIIDVRTPAECHGPEGRIPGARLVPLAEVRRRGMEVLADCEGLVVMLCSHGLRSLFAAWILRKSGRALFSLKGGMNAWNAAGFVVIRDEAAGTSRPAPAKGC